MTILFMLLKNLKKFVKVYRKIKFEVLRLFGYFCSQAYTRNNFHSVQLKCLKAEQKAKKKDGYDLIK